MATIWRPFSWRFMPGLQGSMDPISGSEPDYSSVRTSTAVPLDGLLLQRSMCLKAVSRSPVFALNLLCGIW